MNIVQLTAHSIESYDMLRMHTANGHSVFAIDAYITPRAPHDDKRGGLDIDTNEVLKAAVDRLGQPHAHDEGHHLPVPTGLPMDACSEGHRDPMECSRRWLPDEILQWADVIICHHLEHTWLIPQWQRIREKRVIWRTVGQSSHANEGLMQPLRADGLEIVRYSPKERNLPNFAGEDALIRFYKDPDEWQGWTGDVPSVLNISQGLYQRSIAYEDVLQRRGQQWTSWSFWEAATEGLQTVLAGPQSEKVGGLGTIAMPEMHRLLQNCRAYLYTGTQPASYTLGLIEAMMTGTPVVSVGPAWMRILPYGPQLFEGHEFAPMWSDLPENANVMLRSLLNDADFATAVSRKQRQMAIDTFGIEKVAADWQAYLTGVPARQLVGVAA